MVLREWSPLIWMTLLPNLILFNDYFDTSPLLYYLNPILLGILIGDVEFMY